MPAGLPDVAVFTEILCQGCIACRCQRTSQIGMPGQWGEQVEKWRVENEWVENEQVENEQVENGGLRMTGVRIEKGRG